MGCACGGKKSSSLHDVEVTFRDGRVKKFNTRAEARIAIAADGGGGTMKSVLKIAK